MRKRGKKWLCIIMSVIMISGLFNPNIVSAKESKDGDSYSVSNEVGQEVPSSNNAKYQDNQENGSQDAEIEGIASDIGMPEMQRKKKEGTGIQKKDAPGIDQKAYDKNAVRTFSLNEGAVDTANSQVDTENKITGSCGDLEWSLEKETGLLRFEGTGKMPDYSKASETPWSEVANIIKKISVPKGVTSIGDYAFSNLVELEEVILPEGINNLGKNAFSNCEKLIKVTLPDSIEKVGFQAFSNCIQLSEINIPLSWKECPTSSTNGEISSDYCGHIFEGCKNLKEITIPEGIEEIPSFGFCKSDYLITVNLPTTLKEIRNHTFYDCENLEKIDVPEGVSYIGKAAFCYCGSLKEVSLSEGITELALFSFYKCSSLQKIKLPDSIEKIGYKSFAECTQLSELNIPLNWKECPTASTSGDISADYCGHIFEDCKSLKEITVPEGIEKIPSYGFCKSNYLVTVNIPQTLKTIPNHVFYDCGSLKNINIPKGVSYIGKSAFCYCGSLKEVSLSEGITELALFSFYRCSSLSQIELPDSIEKIGYQSFAECTQLSEINIPLSWKECPTASTSGDINADNTGHIFEGCKKLTKISINAKMNQIPSFGFCGANYLETIILPEGLTQIKNHTFFGCSKLVNVNIPDTVTVLKKSAFCGCSALTEIQLSENLADINSFAFDGCKSLKKIKVPDTVTKLGYQCFANCTNLEEINIPAGWKECPSDTGNTGLGNQGSIFINCDNLVSVTVPEGITEIPDFGFSNCNKLRDVQLPESLLKIGKYAFYNCLNLSSSAVPQKVVEISQEAFSKCKSLLVVNIPDSVENIEKNAFENCSLLKTINYSGSKDKWKAININTIGNSIIDDIIINYDFKVQYTAEDFQGIWEGEYDGNSGSTIVRRHFVVKMKKCIVNGKYGRISGEEIISPSENEDSKYAANGSYQWTGTVNMLTGTFFYQGKTWIEYPEGYDNFDFVTYDGVLSIDKTTLEGINEKSSNRTFEATLLGSTQNSNTEVILTQDNKKYNLLKENKTIIEDSDDKVTITVIPDWNNKIEGKIRIFQKNVSIESKTGVFLDIKPGKIFSPSEDIYVELLDSQGTRVESRKIRLSIKTKLAADLGTNQTTTWYDIWCKGDRYKSYTRNFDLHVGDSIKNTGDKFRAEADIPKEKANEVYITKNGYVRCNIPEELVYSCHEAVLYPNDTDGAFAQFAVAKQSGQSQYVNLVASHLSVIENKMQSYDMYVDINWNGCPKGKIYLKQGNTIINLKEGKNTELILGGKLSRSAGKVYLCWESTNGYSWSQELYLDVYETSASNLSIDGGEKASGTNTEENEKNEVWAGANLSFDLFSDAVPVEMSYEPTTINEGTFKGTLGIKFKDDDRTKKTVIFDQVQSAIKEMKTEFVADGSIKDLKKSLEKTGNKVVGGASQFAISVNTDLIGYVEGTYKINSEGKIVDIQFTDTGVLSDLEGKVSLTRQHFAQGIPWYWMMELKAKMGLNMKFEPEYDEKGAVIAPLKSNASISLGAKTAAGVSGVASLGVKGTGTIHADGQIAPFALDKMELYADYKIELLQCEIGSWVSGSLVTLTGDKYYLLKDKQFFPKNGKISGQKALKMAQNNKQQEWKQLSRDYLEESSKFTANKTAKQRRSRSSKNEIVNLSQFKTNTYTFSEPQLIALDNNKKLMVWVDDSGESNRPVEANRSILYYSVFDGITWSEPQVVQDDKTADMYPVLKKIDNAVYLVWINANKVLDKNDTFKDYCKSMDVAFAEFDVATEKFKNISNIETNNMADILPDITVVNGKPTVVWVQNSEGDVLQQTGEASIYKAFLNNGNWTIEKLKDNLGSVDGICVNDNDGNLEIYFSQDTDQNNFTIEDKEIFKISENGLEQVTDNNIADTKPQISGGKVYWYKNGQITDGKNNIDINEGSDRYNIISNGNDEVILYTKLNDDNTTTIYASYKDKYGWSAPTEVVKTDGYIPKLSGIINEDGKVEFIANQIEMQENTYGQADLQMYSVDRKCNLSIEKADYQEATLSPNRELEITVNVRNSGTATIGKAQISIYDGEKELQSELVNLKLKPGESDSLFLSYTLPENIADIPSGYTVKVIPQEKNDIDLSDNKAQIILRKKDISVENVKVQKVDEKTMVFAYIANRGLETVNNVEVSLCKDSEGKNVLGTKTISSIDVAKGKSISFEKSVEQGEVVYVKAKELSDENSIINNSGFTLVSNSDSITDFKMKSIDLEKITVNVEKDSFVYTGKEIEPKVTINNFVAGKDYSLTYKDNIDVGTASVTIKGTSDKVSGEKTITFQIIKAKPEISVENTIVKNYGDEPFVLGASVTGGGKLTYESANKEIVEVSESGIVTIKGKGSTRIEISAKESANYTGISKVINIIIKEKAADNLSGKDDAPNTKPVIKTNEVKSIKISGISNQIAQGKKISLKATVLPANADNKKLLWKSSNTKIATVTQTGKVLVKKGTAGKQVIITATAMDNSGSKATWKIKSMKGIVKKISLTGKKKVNAGGKIKLKAKVTSTKKANTKILWKSSNSKYATVDKKGVVRTKKSAKRKTIKITAMATDGSGVKAVIKIKIQ